MIISFLFVNKHVPYNYTDANILKNVANFCEMHKIFPEFPTFALNMQKYEKSW